MQNLYCVLVEVTHMKDTPLPADCGGAIVRVYLGADDIRQAIDCAERTLLEDRYRPLATLEAYLIEADNYTDDDESEPEDHIPSYEELLDLLDSGDIWYSAFHLYPLEEHTRLH